ncbi:uncharacterized protein LOC124443573 [Xenia sp. Carnegie-2017]|uniref:uncharacterized protein LOC124443573 n=1 Tax=Xenia sp. Carnegie-2017 TaxID=2897299 RepID=UPI001F039772|nr:uncharacterized protein LOC124443573 [Xenia sp. Carnegie-2017]
MALRDRRRNAKFRENFQALDDVLPTVDYRRSRLKIIVDATKEMKSKNSFLDEFRQHYNISNATDEEVMGRVKDDIIPKEKQKKESEKGNEEVVQSFKKITPRKLFPSTPKQSTPENKTKITDFYSNDEFWQRFSPSMAIKHGKRRKLAKGKTFD